MRKVELANGEFYHVYNRGTDKRSITQDRYDSKRLIQSILLFNVTEPIGSIFQYNRMRRGNKRRSLKSSNPITTFERPLVEIIAYCFNPNHFHFLIRQLEDDGISKFMQKFGIGYTRYFNEKYERSGVLFQGKFKARRIKSDHDLLRISAYVNLNNKVHSLSPHSTKFVRSSWPEYTEDIKTKICSKDIILGQFNSTKEYTQFAQETVAEIVSERKLIDNSDKKKSRKEFYGYYFD